jgi:lipopolysaccharide assembly LapA-like protein
MPVYLLVTVVLLLGVLAGLGLGWWGGRHHRRHARQARREAERLDREVQRLRDSHAAAAPSSGAAAPAPRDQRAIERQSALVAPQLSSQMSPPLPSRLLSRDRTAS